MPPCGEVRLTQPATGRLRRRKIARSSSRCRILSSRPILGADRASQRPSTSSNRVSVLGTGFGRSIHAAARSSADRPAARATSARRARQAAARTRWMRRPRAHASTSIHGRERFELAQRRPGRHRQGRLAAATSIEGVGRRHPRAVRGFGVVVRRRLTGRHPRDEKSGVEAAHVNRRRQPVGERHERIERDAQPFRLDHLAQRSRARVNIAAMAPEPDVKPGIVEPDELPLSVAREQNAGLFEQLAHCRDVIGDGVGLDARRRGEPPPGRRRHTTRRPAPRDPLRPRGHRERRRRRA